MKRTTLASLLVSALCLVPLACGSSSGSPGIIGGPACGVGACGGDITGTWNLTDICIDKGVLMTTFVSSLMGACPGATLGNVDSGESGSFMFNTDGSYNLNITMNISIGMNLPLSCFPSGTTCAVVDAAIMQSVAGDPSIMSASCAGTNPCVCTMTEVPMTLSEAGTYTASGSSLVTMPTTGSSASNMTYCVKSNVVTMKDATPDPNNPVTAFVATKQ